MKFIGTIHKKVKNEKFHSIEIPDLGIYTQGKNIEDSLNMAKDSLEELLNIKVEVKQLEDTTFTITAKNLKPLVARFLSTMRLEAGLTIMEVTKKLGKTSPNFYAQYEQGKSLPSMEMISEFIRVISPETSLLLVTKKVG